MITRSDIYDALSMLIANAADKTPDAGEMTIRAWADYFDSHPRWNGDDLVAAAHEFCQRPRERLVQPADLGEIISVWYQDKFDRGLIERDSPYEDLGGLSHPSDDRPRIDRHGYIDKTAPDEPPYPADWDTDKRLRAYWDKVRNNRHRPGAEPTETCADCEHLPGEECADPDCRDPSTFGPYCARHYCLSFGAVGRAIPS